MSSPESLMEKIKALPPEGQDEVEDFVDFLPTKDEQRQLVDAAMRLSEPSLAAIWDNPEDDVYNDL